MTLRRHRRARRCVGVALALLAGGSLATRSEERPAIELALPAYGSEDDLVGRVRGIAPETHRVAVYLFLEGGGWWTKPRADRPCAPIDATGEFRVDVTSGGCDAYATRFAVYALPADASCEPAMGSAVPPAQVVSSAIASAIAVRDPQRESPLLFAGRPWVRRDSRCPAGPGPNRFDPRNAWVDERGELHLAIVQKPGGGFSSAEVTLAESLGYGTYTVRTRGRVDLLDPRMVLGLFTWSSWSPPHHAELDLEVSRFGDPFRATNANFAVQPADAAGHLESYPLVLDDADDRLTFVLEWLPSAVAFATFRGHHAGAPPDDALVRRWTFRGAEVPESGLENFRLNFWLHRGEPPLDGLGREVVISGFDWMPPRPGIGARDGRVPARQAGRAQVQRR